MLAGVGWLGEVLVVIFVLAPAVNKVQGATRVAYLQETYPRVFRLASVLSLTAVISGVGVYLARFNWSLQLAPLVETRWGLWILVGSSLGVLLTAFHFFAEAKLEPAISQSVEPADVNRMVWIVTVVPRIGVFVLLGAALAMMYAARGL